MKRARRRSPLFRQSPQTVDEFDDSGTHKTVVGSFTRQSRLKQEFATEGEFGDEDPNTENFFVFVSL